MVRRVAPPGTTEGGRRKIRTRIVSREKFGNMIINIKNDGVFSEFETADRSGTSGGRNSTLMSQDPIKTPSGMESAVKDESFRSAIPSVCPA